MGNLIKAEKNYSQSNYTQRKQLYSQIRVEYENFTLEAFYFYYIGQHQG